MEFVRTNENKGNLRYKMNLSAQMKIKGIYNINWICSGGGGYFWKIFANYQCMMVIFLRIIFKWIFGNQKYYKKLCPKESINSIWDFFNKRRKKKKAFCHGFFRCTCRAQCSEQEDMLGIVWGAYLKKKKNNRNCQDALLSFAIVLRIERIKKQNQTMKFRMKIYVEKPWCKFQKV